MSHAIRVSLLLTLVVGMSDAAIAGIAGGSGAIHVLHYTGPPLEPERNPGFDPLMPPAGSVTHLNMGTSMPNVVWDPLPANFSLSSQADLKNAAGLVIGSTSVSGDFVYTFDPGGTSHFVGWPELLRITQVNPQLQVTSPSVLRVDFSVTYTLDAAGIPVGGLPIEVDFRTTNRGNFGRYDYEVTWSSVFNSQPVDDITLMGTHTFMGNETFHEQNPTIFDPPKTFAPAGLDPQAVISVNGFFQLQVKNDDVPAELTLENFLAVPEPVTLWFVVAAIVGCQAFRQKRSATTSC